MRNPIRSSYAVPLACVIAGVTIAVWIAPKNGYFWENFAYYWLPQAAVVVLAWLCKASRGVLGGTAITLALYLVLFDIWATESMAWLFYLFSFPGALSGALLAAFISKKRGDFIAAITAFFTVIIGITLNLVVIYLGAS
jgi:hypothetical protein